mmetsp:Transcript_129630/g.323103  ORF Transcript_129630/g.323103 Transcript_129630/m.323103 type:complete len:220 (-) Transcript_129630:179-838(-)
MVVWAKTATALQMDSRTPNQFALRRFGPRILLRMLVRGQAPKFTRQATTLSCYWKRWLLMLGTFEPCVPACVWKSVVVQALCRQGCSKSCVASQRSLMLVTKSLFRHSWRLTRIQLQRHARRHCCGIVALSLRTLCVVHYFLACGSLAWWTYWCAILPMFQQMLVKCWVVALRSHGPVARGDVRLSTCCCPRSAKSLCPEVCFTSFVWLRMNLTISWMS